MAFTYDLNSIVLIGIPAKSFNPVLKLTLRNKKIVWAKVAAGAERISFANNVMKMAGFERQGVELYNTPEGLAALETIEFLYITYRATLEPGSPYSLFVEKLKEMRENVQKPGQKLVIMEHVGGVGTVQSTLRDDDHKPADGAIETFIRLMSHRDSQRDFARMMAADLLLGNYDRLGYFSGDFGASEHQINTNNFILAAKKGGFLPIDNDTISPSLNNIHNPDFKKESTQEDLYKVAIMGGAMYGEGTLAGVSTFGTPHYIASDTQSSMNELLGPNSEKRIFGLLKSMINRLGPKDDSYNEELQSITSRIAPKVRESARKLVNEIKQGGSGKGLMETLKACRNVEAMNYSTFKIKSRFMKLMTESKEAPTVDSTNLAIHNAFRYGKYREWKETFDRILNLNPEIFYVDVLTVGTSAPVMTGFAPGVPLPSGNKDNSPELAAAAQKVLAGSVSAPDDYRKARTLYQQLQATYRTADVRMKKRIAEALMLQELAEIAHLLRQVSAQEVENDIVAFGYKKALSKRRMQLNNLVAAYQRIASRLDRQAMMGSHRPTLSASLTVVKPLVEKI